MQTDQLLLVAGNKNVWKNSYH